jgi:homoserine kinase
VNVRAPASTANLGPSFDCAAAALDLWNELTLEPVAGGFEVEIEGEGADELPRDHTHLTLRAFALFTPVDGYRFTFVNRIPLERGLGSSAAAIALGLLAGAAASGGEHTLADLLEAGAPLEGHSDNLAAALYGGVCVSWSRNGHVAAARIAAQMPAEPVLTIPSARANTARSRAALPETVSHGDAATTAASATLLGAAIAGADPGLLRDAFNDRLHEPYRASSAPLLDAVRASDLPGAVGATLSGSGPSVVVWAEKDSAERVAAALERALPDGTRVLPLRVAHEGASIRP